MIRTAEDTISLVRRLARHHPDAQIAGILNRQGRHSATGERFTASIVGSLRRYWSIERFEPSPEREGQPVSVGGRHGSWASCPRPSTAGSTTGSSPPSRSRRAPRGASGSPSTCAPASWRRRLWVGCRCSRRRTLSGSRVRRCCSVSSAASCAPSTCGKDAEEACGSRSRSPIEASLTPSPQPGGSVMGRPSRR